MVLMGVQVATAQKGELKLVQGLTGDPDKDNPNLEDLQTMFSGGIKQNQQNAKDVSLPRYSVTGDTDQNFKAASGCTIDD